eukprot:307873-Rhodomonas_salina.1
MTTRKHIRLQVDQYSAMHTRLSLTAYHSLRGRRFLTRQIPHSADTFCARPSPPSLGALPPSLPSSEPG